MPVVLRAYGLRFVIYVHDHEPPHVHAYGDGEAKIDLGSDSLPPAMLYSLRMSKAIERRALRAVTEHQAMLLLKWAEIHD